MFQYARSSSQNNISAARFAGCLAMLTLDGASEAKPFFKQALKNIRLTGSIGFAWVLFAFGPTFTITAWGEGSNAPLSSASSPAVISTNAAVPTVTNAITADSANNVFPTETASSTPSTPLTNAASLAATNTLFSGQTNAIAENRSLLPLDVDRREKGIAPSAVQPQINASLRDESVAITNANLSSRPGTNTSAPIKGYQDQINFARQQRHENNPQMGEKILMDLLTSKAPEEFKRTALLELAFAAQAQGQLPKAQQIFSQFVRQYPEDPSLPEVLLRQGLLYRQMGATTLAISKFYAVMNACLNLKLDRFDYYKRLVLQSQTEIADTYYLLGQFADASDYFGRLLKQNNADLNKEQILFKLVRSLSNLDHPTETAAKAQQFLASYQETADAPEARFLLADALRKLGRNREAMEQVVALLESQQSKSAQNPEVWAYWQRKTGNEIANQLYKDGDYVNALEIYLNLIQLDTNSTWRIPVWYQTALVYEKLRQPGKAAEVYAKILARSTELGPTNSSPGLSAVLDMARWRSDYLSWQTQAEGINERMSIPPSLQLASTNAP